MSLPESAWKASQSWWTPIVGHRVIFERGAQLVLSASLALIPFFASGCGFASMIETNTAAIHQTTAAMKTAGDRVDTTNRTMASMQSSLDQASGLREPMQALASMAQPMEELAEMKPSMDLLRKSVADAMVLREPMQELSKMNPILLRIEGLKKPMEDMTDMRPALEGVTALKPSLDDVATLNTSMKAVADLKEPMERVAALRTSLEETSKLAQPISDIAAMSRSSSFGTSKIAMLFAAWGLVTFVGVYFGVVLGLRQTRRPRARTSTARRSTPESLRTPIEAARPN
jgi:hypothetical protein